MAGGLQGVARLVRNALQLWSADYMTGQAVLIDGGLVDR